MSGKKTKGQLRVFKELENQLFIQAERLGIRDRYPPLKLKEMELEAYQKHLSAFYSERANLEYEMQNAGSDKKEVLIKLERLEVYIKRAERLKEACKKGIHKLLGKLTPEKEKVDRAVPPSKISVVIGANE